MASEELGFVCLCCPVFCLMECKYYLDRSVYSNTYCSVIIRLWYVIAASILKIESASFCFIFIFGTTLSFQIC